MQAALLLTATRGVGAAEARICYERAEVFCHSLNRPMDLYVTLMGQLRHSSATGKLTRTMRLAERGHSLAQQENSPAASRAADPAMGATLYVLGAYEAARQYATRGVPSWR